MNLGDFRDQGRNGIFVSFYCCRDLEVDSRTKSRRNHTITERSYHRIERLDFEKDNGLKRRASIFSRKRLYSDDLYLQD